MASRLIGERVEARLYAERVEVWYAQKRVERLPRLRGRGKHRIDYRHVIDWLVRKPGAFADYRYRDGSVPSRAASAWPTTCCWSSSRSGRPRSTCGSCTWRRGESEAGVEAALERLLDGGRPLECGRRGGEVASAVTGRCQ